MPGWSGAFDDDAFLGLVNAPVPVRPEVVGALQATWSDLARPGSTWRGDERVALARASRAARAGEETYDSHLPGAAIEAVQRVAARPATLDRDYVESAVDALGEQGYVELVGLVSTLTAVDTLTQLVGADIADLPDPVPGDAAADGEIVGLKRRSAWVSMAGPPRPRFSLSAAPRAQTTFNRLLDTLYMTRDELHTASPVRGLGRSQMELVILGISHSNECFY